LGSVTYAWCIRELLINMKNRIIQAEK